jgi:hypothetical protein
LTRSLRAANSGRKLAPQTTKTNDAERGMSNRVGTIAGIAVGIVVVTYVGLNLIKPFKQHDEQLPAGAAADAGSGQAAAGESRAA